MQITSWKTDPRVIMAFLFGFTLLCVEGYPYLKFAAFVRSDVQSVEMFVLCGSDGFAFMALFLGNLLLLSNAPFLRKIKKQCFLPPLFPAHHFFSYLCLINFYRKNGRQLHTAKE